MNLTWDNFLGSSPDLYAQKVLKECGLKEPPICEKTVADYLGLELKEFSLENAPQKGRLIEIIKTCCAWLQKKPDGKGCIWVHGETMRERKRLSVFHECGHEVLPWHEEHDYFCTEKDVSPEVRKKIEREAFSCGSEFLMPKKSFIGDVLSLETGVTAIEQLGQRYVASMEATAICYARNHPGLCGIVMLESSENHRPPQKGIIAPGQSRLPYKIQRRPGRPFDTERYPLIVKYSVKSHHFPKYIRSGQGIEGNNRIFEAWYYNRQIREEIPAAVFGSSAKWSYNAECLPLGNTGRMLVLLWLPSRQLKFNFDNGVML